MAILATSDFAAGFWAISQNDFNNEDLQHYIEITEERILRDLMGDTMYLTYVAELELPSPSADYVALRDGENYIDPEDGDKRIIYKGFTDMLKGFTYFHYIRDYRYNNRVSGVHKGIGENSVVASNQEVNNMLRIRYNQAIDRYCEAVKFINDKNETSPETFVNFSEKSKEKIGLNGYIF